MSEVSVTRDVVYGEAGEGRPLRLDLYRPAAPNGAAVILVHGGGWSKGDRSMLVEHAKHLARDGFVALVPEYRLTPEAHWPAQIHDVKRAIRWTRSQAASLGFEPERLCLQGHSAGAHLVLLAAGTPNERRLDPPEADTSIPAACAAVAAIYPPVLMYRGETRPSGGTAARALPGCDASDEACQLASPIHHLGAGYPPAMLLHGDVDKIVPVSASRRFEEALRAAGGKVDLHIFAGLPHGFANNPKLRPMLMTMISAFFQRTVADPAAFVMETPPPAREPAPAWQG
ncbi:alpha/beta hydrolase [Phenylobacterium sp.]|jgi:acetyl esterase/lipase|uniref:alpha/beta hydrolase n=1 Tax=Phenylobacterium sp. TaxID=1871053 RepID=UPI002E354DC4|nr:alpha/beta hydrolase [Phenylobacterium sp.]HEX2559043.1 alpha/beta hydrolase [Phenylobacterium sp.]